MLLRKLLLSLTLGLLISISVGLSTPITTKADVACTGRPVIASNYHSQNNLEFMTDCGGGSFQRFIISNNPDNPLFNKKINVNGTMMDGQAAFFNDTGNYDYSFGRDSIVPYNFHPGDQWYNFLVTVPSSPYLDFSLAGTNKTHYNIWVVSWPTPQNDSSKCSTQIISSGFKTCPIGRAFPLVKYNYDNGGSAAARATLRTLVDMDIDNDGDMIVTDQTNGHIFQFTSAYLKDVIGQGLKGNYLNNPESIPDLESDSRIIDITKNNPQTLSKELNGVSHNDSDIYVNVGNSGINKYTKTSGTYNYVNSYTVNLNGGALDGMTSFGGNFYSATTNGYISVLLKNSTSVCNVQINTGKSVSFDGIQVDESGQIYVSAKGDGIYIVNKSDIDNAANGCSGSPSAQGSLYINTNTPSGVEWDDISPLTLPKTNLVDPFLNTTGGNTYTQGVYNDNNLNGTFSDSLFVKGSSSPDLLGSGSASRYNWNLSQFPLPNPNFSSLYNGFCPSASACNTSSQQIGSNSELYSQTDSSGKVYIYNPTAELDLTKVNSNFKGILIVNNHDVTIDTSTSDTNSKILLLVNGTAIIKSAADDCTATTQDSPPFRHADISIIANNINYLSNCDLTNPLTYPLKMKGIAISNQSGSINFKTSSGGRWWPSDKGIPGIQVQYDPSVIDLVSKYFNDGGLYQSELGL